MKNGTKYEQSIHDSPLLLYFNELILLLRFSFYNNIVCEVSKSVLQCAGLKNTHFALPMNMQPPIKVRTVGWVGLLRWI